ncbi:glycosyltransferase [Olivibacter sp. XZL3]|uniref:glycosyltransferase n=1 Tax=Olivibacter sp. XZL3 TaxID=1735116 RepID=UPI001F10A70A|nr:glycosyltransferase [Olivibacter sp. XZL3]
MEKIMKILRVISSMNPTHGGPCQGIRNSVPALQSHGIENDVVSLDDPSAAYLGNDPFTIYALGNSRGPWAYNSKLLGWLTDNLSKYDAVIIHGLWLYHSYAAFKAVKVLRKAGSAVPKVFIMPHGMLDPYFQKAEGRKLKALRNNLYWKLIESKVVNGVDGVLFTCEEELLLARTTFSAYHPKKELNVGYGIRKPKARTPEMHAALKERLGEVADRPYLLFLSRIHEKKGVDLLIKAYKSVAKTIEGQHKIPALVIAGPGLDTVFGKQMIELAASHASIVFPGMLSGDLKWAAFHYCEVFILPSHQENFGISVVEALACEKPVLITDKVNIWREIKSEGAGIIDKDTLDGIVTLLKEWILMDLAGKSFLTTRAYSAYEKYFTVEKAAVNMGDTIRREVANA